MPAPRRHGSRAVRTVVVACFLISLGACAGPESSPAPGSTVDPVTVFASNGFVRVTLTLEEPPRNDALSWVSVTIQNIANRVVRWAGGGCGDPGTTFIDLSGAVDYGRADWAGRLRSFKDSAIGGPGAAGNGALTVAYVPESRLNSNVACTADLRIETFAAGGVFRYRAAWDGKLDGHAAPTGRATVLASFPFTGLEGVVPPDQFEPTPVRASIATSIDGSNSDARISPGQAIDAALGDAQFAGFVNETPEASWVNPDVSLIDGIWHVGLFRTKGEQTINGYVMVNATGQVVGRRFDR